MKIIPLHIEKKPEYPVGKYISEWIDFINTITPFVIEQTGGKSINIWVRGSSGAILAALLAKNLPNDIDIIHIKKEGENSHNSNTNISLRYEYNIILDDFIDSGATMIKIWEQAGKYVKSIDLMIVYSVNTWYCNIGEVIPKTLIISQVSYGELVEKGHDWSELVPTGTEIIEDISF